MKLMNPIQPGTIPPKDLEIIKLREILKEAALYVLSNQEDLQTPNPTKTPKTWHHEFKLHLQKRHKLPHGRSTEPP